MSEKLEIKLHEFRGKEKNLEMVSKYGISRTFLRHIEMYNDENGEYGNAIIYTNSADQKILATYFTDGENIYLKLEEVMAFKETVEPLLCALSEHLWDAFYTKCKNLTHIVFLLKPTDTKLKDFFKQSKYFTMSEGDGDLAVYVFGVNDVPNVDRTLPFISSMIGEKKKEESCPHIPFTLEPQISPYFTELNNLVEKEELTDIQIQIEKDNTSTETNKKETYSCKVVHKNKAALKFTFAVLPEDEYLLFDSMSVANTSDIDVETFKKIIRTICVFLSQTFASKTKGYVGFFIDKNNPEEIKLKEVFDTMGDFFIVTDLEKENTFVYTYNHLFYNLNVKVKMEENN